VQARILGRGWALSSGYVLNALNAKTNSLWPGARSPMKWFSIVTSDYCYLMVLVLGYLVSMISEYYYFGTLT